MINRLDKLAILCVAFAFFIGIVDPGAGVSAAFKATFAACFMVAAGVFTVFSMIIFDRKP